MLSACFGARIFVHLNQQVAVIANKCKSGPKPDPGDDWFKPVDLFRVSARWAGSAPAMTPGPVGQPDLLWRMKAARSRRFLPNALAYQPEREFPGVSSMSGDLSSIVNACNLPDLLGSESAWEIAA